MRASLETRCGCIRSINVQYPPPRYLHIGLGTKSKIVDYSEEKPFRVPMQTRRFALTYRGEHTDIAYYEEEE